MTIKRFTARPSSFVMSQWTGDNLEQLEKHYDTKFQVNLDGSLCLFCQPFNQGDVSVPVGHWFAPQFMGSLSPEEVAEQLQEAPEGPFKLQLVQD